MDLRKICFRYEYVYNNTYSRHSDKLPGTLFKTDVTFPKESNPPWLLDFRVFSHPVKGSFQLSLTVLILYRSSDVFKVGS